ncbi:MAG: magnesium chelatase subunit D family protein [Deltaproteobacteria bacterium]|nr:magnesium chelatase subunit D family protein [Deltaproteobacteria bacterium]
MVRSVYPFTAIVDQEGMKKALILTVIDPTIGGVLIRGQRGTAKSTAVRALANLLPMIDVVKGCPFHCHPSDPHLMCEDCRRRFEETRKPLPSVTRKMRVVELPIGATEDRVIGTLDMETALQTGQRSFEPGILAEVHRGFLYVDEINLLPDHLVDILLDAAAMGVNYVEREGISFSHPSRFVLVGTMNPEEGELRPQLMDRFGVCVEVRGIETPEIREEVVLRRLAYDRDPDTFLEQWKSKDERLGRAIFQAQRLLNTVKLTSEALRMISRICSDLKIDGHRGDITMAKAAVALAAYYGHQQVREQDVREAAALVLPHRIRRSLMDEDVQFSLETVDQAIEKAKQSTPLAEIGSVSEKKKSLKTQEGDGKVVTRVHSIGEDRFDLTFPKLDLHPSHQTISGKSVKAQATFEGAYVRSVLPQGKPRDIALDATMRMAAMFQHQRRGEKRGPLIIRSEDIRVKWRQKKGGRCILFVVDASGSMGVQEQMRETKAAILSLLSKAYQNRDRIGLVVFHGTQANLVLPPTGSVDLGRKYLKRIPTGGKTPLAAGLALGLSTLKTEQLKYPDQTFLLVIVSDGRANVAFNGGDPLDDAVMVAKQIRKAAMDTMFIDTEIDPCAFGYGWDLAKIMKATYIPLGQLDSGRLVSLLS